MRSSSSTERWDSAAGFRPSTPRDDLVAHLAVLAPADGTTTVGAWPGLTVHRCVEGIEFGRLSIGFLVPVDGDPSYAIGTGTVTLDHPITAAAPRRGILLGVLAIDPQLVRATSTRMHTFNVVGAPPGCDHTPAMSRLDGVLLKTVTDFLGALAHRCDRRVLAPLRIQEMVYRLLHHQQRTRLLTLAAPERERNQVTAALDHIAEHLGEPLPIEMLAGHVNLSPSAFTRAFRAATGRSPHQYIKEARLDHARALLHGRRIGVSAVARAAGYSSVSHFIKEFDGRFGSTPGDYAAATRLR